MLSWPWASVCFRDLGLLWSLFIKPTKCLLKISHFLSYIWQFLNLWTNYITGDHQFCPHLTHFPFRLTSFHEGSVSYSPANCEIVTAQSVWGPSSRSQIGFDWYGAVCSLLLHTPCFASLGAHQTSCVCLGVHQEIISKSTYSPFNQRRIWHHSGTNDGMFIFQSFCELGNQNWTKVAVPISSHYRRIIIWFEDCVCLKTVLRGCI